MMMNYYSLRSVLGFVRGVQPFLSMTFVGAFCFSLVSLSAGCKDDSPSKPQAKDAEPALDPESAFREQARTWEKQLRTELAEANALLEKSPDDSPLLLKRADLYRKLRSYVDIKGKLDLQSKAIADFETVNRVAGPKGSAKALIGIARSYLAVYQLREAVDYVERARTMDPNDIDVRLETAFLVGMSSGDWKEAVEKIRALGDEPGMQKNARYWHAIGFGLNSQGKYAEARDAFQKAMDLEPEAIERWTNIGQTYADEGNSSEAKVYFDRVRAVDPTNAFAINNQAASLIGTRDPKKCQEAVILLEQLLSTGPGFAAAWNNLGNGLTNLGRYPEAVRAYQRALALVPCYFDALDNLGLAEAQAGRHEQAVAAFEKAIACKPDLSRLYYHLGNSFNVMGKREEAISAFKKAGELDPNDVRIWTNMGSVYLDMGKLDEAVTATERALSIKPNHTIAVGNRGVIEMRRGKHAKSIPHLRRAVELNPTGERNLNNLNISALYANQGDAVLTFYEELLSKNNQLVIVRYYKGGLEFGLGRFDAADRELSKSLESDSGAQQIRFQRALARLAQNKPQEALADLKKLLSDTPEHCYGHLYAWVASLRAEQDQQADEFARTGLRACKDDSWATTLLQFASGEKSADQLLEKAETKEKKCEGYFFVAEKVRSKEGAGKAAEWYRRCEETGVKEFFEYALCKYSASP